ncbi:hypothetical protein [Bartonella mastomydis]|uniref:hypothetical protein n=1 Tax=Bartonella mastomydis TaxID=1820002 RepID=UPI0011177CEF|nr:hypothetical protein [Bartonella mastomydis]
MNLKIPLQRTRDAREKLFYDITESPIFFFIVETAIRYFNPSNGLVDYRFLLFILEILGIKEPTLSDFSSFNGLLFFQRYFILKFIKPTTHYKQASSCRIKHVKDKELPKLTQFILFYDKAPFFKGHLNKAIEIIEILNQIHWQNQKPNWRQMPHKFHVS